MTVKIGLFVADDNQVYQAISLDGSYLVTLKYTSAGPNLMRFTPLETFLFVMAEM